MNIRGLVTLAVLCIAPLLSACGSGSGRQGTDLAVTGTGPTGQVLGGQTAVYTMTVSNVGENTARDVKIFNSVGNQQSLVSITCSASGGAVCPDPVGVSMSSPSIPRGGQLVFVVTLQLISSARGTITNSMSASHSDEINGSNNSFTVTATAYSISTDLVVTGVGPGGTVTGGGALDFQMTVANNGPDTAIGVNIINSLGNGATLTGISCIAGGGAVCPPTGVGMTTDLPAGGTLTFTVSTKVSQGINGTLSNTMSANVSTDPDRSNNSFTVSASVVTPQSGVFVTGVGPAGTVSGGSNATFTMTVGNSGPDAATSVTIVNNVGSNLTLTGLTCAASGGATCPAALGPVMTVDMLPANGSLAFSVTAFVALGTNGAITNTMSATASNDFSHTQRSATAVGTASTPRATLVLGGTGPSSPVAGGGTAVFTMTVGNSGPNDATGLKVVNSVGSNLTFTGATCSASGGAICPLSVGVVSDVGTLPVGGQLTFNVSALVAPNTNGAITNTITATAENAFSATGNSAVAVGQAFTARSNITVTGVGPANVPSGTSASFAMTLGNTGPQAADSVHLINTVGANLTLSSIACTAAGGATCPATTGPVMDVAALPVGGSLTFNVTAFVAPGTQGSLTNTLNATVTSGVRTEVVGVAVGSTYSANVSVSGAAPSGPLAGGSSASFAMVVANSGPGTALNVDITNSIGTGLSPSGNIVCVAGGGAVCPASPGASMVAPSIPAGSFLNFTVPVTVNAGVNGTVSNTMTATAAGDPRASDNSAVATVNAISPDLGVSQTGPAQIAAGSTALFTAVVANPGPSAASNVSISYALSGIAGLTPSISCTATAGATCPTALGPSMSVPTLAAGRSLIFTITVPLPDAARGTLLSSMSVTADGDPSLANNQASISTAVIDPRNGTYKVVAADGREYDMTIDFDAGQYTMVGNGQSVQRTFTADAGGGGFTVAGTSRFRTATDLVVGGHDFGSGVLPYVAGRKFITSVSPLNSCQIGGQYNLATRNVPATGPATTHAGTACVANNVLLVCQSDTQPVALPQNCPAGSLKSYSLSVSGTLFSGTELSTGEKFSFRAADSGALLMLLSAGPASDGSLQMRIGVPDAPAIAGGTLYGASTSGDWVTMTLSNTSYAATGASGSSDSATLSRLSAIGGPFAMRSGPLVSNNQKIFVMQASPLAVMFGDFGGGASGLMQVAVP